MSSAATGRRSFWFGDRLALRGRRQQNPAGGAILNTTSTEVTNKSGDYLRSGIRLFHDADQQPPGTAKQPNEHIHVDANQFDGSYISLVAELDPETASQISVGADLVVHLDIETQVAMPAYVRAHFSNEEDREVLHDLIVVANGPRCVRFHLDGLRIPLDVATTAWIDVVFSDPSGTTLNFSTIALAIEEQ